MKELVSIVIPTYNRSHLIKETLDSVIAQTYQKWECIIVDDNSTDHTETVVQRYCKTDSRFRFYKKPKNLLQGPSAARNYGFTKSKGTYINWFDSDDIMHREKLETDLKHIQSGEYDFTISQSQFFSETGKPTKKYWNEKLWSDDPINDFIQLKIGWGVNASLWKKSSLIRSKLYFNECILTADDYLYHLQALELQLKPIIINKTLSSLRVHPQRLNEYKLKSPSKLIVNLYLIKKRNQLGLNESSLNFLNHQYKNQFLNLLKNKKIKVASVYLFKSLKYPYFNRLKMELVKYFCIGSVYKILGYGYKFLK